MNANIIIAICYYAVLLELLWVMWKEQKPKKDEIFAVTIPDLAMEDAPICKLRKTYRVLLALVAVVFALLPATIFAWVEMLTEQLLAWMVLFLLLVVCSYLPYAIANQRAKAIKKEKRYMEQAPGLPEVDGLWKCGIFYYNPQDPHLQAKKKIGIGTCINHARPMGKILTVIGCVAILAVLWLGGHLVRMQKTPLFLELEDGVLKAGQTSTNYKLDVDMMQMALLLDDLPKEERLFGTGMVNVERGLYNVSGFGNCKVNLNPQNHAFIVIYAEDGCYIFSAGTDSQTKEVYEELKQEL